MSKWEYCRIDWLEGAGKVSEAQETHASDISLTVIKNDPDSDDAVVMNGDLHFLRAQTHLHVGRLSDAITQLGLEGWELVGVIGHTERAADGRLKDETYWFKRQVQE